METVLRLFWPHAVLALCFIGFVILVAFAGVAAAQEAGPVTVDQIAAPAAGPRTVPWWLETGVQALALVLGAVWTAVGAWQAKNFPAAKAAKTALDQTLDAMNWETHIRNAVYSAFGYAAGEVKPAEELKTPAEKAEFLRQARGYINKVNAEIPAEHGEDTDLILLAHLNQITNIKTPPSPVAAFASLGTGKARKVEARN